MTNDKKWQEHKCLPDLPVIENITGRHEFFRMRIMKLVKKVQVAVKKYRTQKRVITRIITCINGRYSVIALMSIGGNPVIENTKRREQEEGKKQSAAQNKTATLGHVLNSRKSFSSSESLEGEGETMVIYWQPAEFPARVLFQPVFDEHL